MAMASRRRGGSRGSTRAWNKSYANGICAARIPSSLKMAHRQSGPYKEEPGVAVAVAQDHVSVPHFLFCVLYIASRPGCDGCLLHGFPEDPECLDSSLRSPEGVLVDIRLREWPSFTRPGMGAGPSLAAQCSLRPDIVPQTNLASRPRS